MVVYKPEDYERKAHVWVVEQRTSKGEWVPTWWVTAATAVAYRTREEARGRVKDLLRSDSWRRHRNSNALYRVVRYWPVSGSFRLTE